MEKKGSTARRCFQWTEKKNRIFLCLSCVNKLSSSSFCCWGRPTAGQLQYNNNPRLNALRTAIQIPSAVLQHPRITCIPAWPSKYISSGAPDANENAKLLSCLNIRPIGPPEEDAARVRVDDDDDVMVVRAAAAIWCGLVIIDRLFSSQSSSHMQ